MWCLWRQAYQCEECVHAHEMKSIYLTLDVDPLEWWKGRFFYCVEILCVLKIVEWGVLALMWLYTSSFRPDRSLLFALHSMSSFLWHRYTHNFYLLPNCNINVFSVYKIHETQYSILIACVSGTITKLISKKQKFILKLQMEMDDTSTRWYHYLSLYINYSSVCL